jgi:Flp pilus assembly protein TadG
MAGLAVDLGRMYITREEAQSYADSASIAAALQLDGTQAGITRATAAAANSANYWQFGGQKFTNVTTLFGTSSTGPWVASPGNAAGYYYTQVVPQVQLPLSLMRVLTHMSVSNIGAGAVAGRIAITSLNGGEFPFSPYTRIASPDNASDPYGYQIGNQYTLRWGAPGNNTSCGTDATQPNLAQSGTVRGYCCATNAATLRAAIVSGDTDNVTIGSPVPMSTGDKDTEMTAIAMRVNEDTDTTSTTYTQYLSLGRGNGERVVVVPVNAGSANSYNMVGFAAFFLLNSSYYTNLGGNNSACAIYIGAWVEGGGGSHGPGGSGAYHVKLYQ